VRVSGAGPLAAAAQQPQVPPDAHQQNHFQSVLPYGYTHAAPVHQKSGHQRQASGPLNASGIIAAENAFEFVEVRL
jgi:hypothetical protein